MIYACPLGCVKCFVWGCVPTAVQQQAVHLDHESLDSQSLQTCASAHTHGPAVTGTADSTNRVTCVYTVSSSLPHHTVCTLFYG